MPIYGVFAGTSGLAPPTQGVVRHTSLVRPGMPTNDLIRGGLTESRTHSLMKSFMPSRTDAFTGF